MLLALLPLIAFAQSQWTWRNPLPQGNPLNAVASTGKQWVAVGHGGAILTSPDGIDWTAHGSGTSANLTYVGSIGTGLVAVGE